MPHKFRHPGESRIKSGPKTGDKAVSRQKPETGFFEPDFDWGLSRRGGETGNEDKELLQEAKKKKIFLKQTEI